MTRVFGGVVRPLSTLLCALFTSAALAAGFDERTLLLALFDASLDADYARGRWQADGAGALTRLGEGRRGAALMLRDRARLDFAADGNLNPREGTIEFWLKPNWAGNDPETHSLFGFQASSLNFLNINCLAGGRLGVAVSGGQLAEDRVWRRVDADVSGWKAGEWHHLAVVWGKGQVHLYVDGKEQGTAVTDAKPIEGKPEIFSLIGGGALIDELRVSGVMRTAAEIAAAAWSEQKTAQTVTLSDFPPASAKQDMGMVGLNQRLRPDTSKLPLILGGAMCRKGIAAEGNSEVIYDLAAWAQVGKPYETLRCTVGVDDLAGPDASAAFQVFGDEKKLFDSGALKKGATKDVGVSVGGVKRLRLVTQGEALADWIAPMALPAGAQPLPAMSRKLTKEQLEMYRRAAEADRFSFPLAAPDKGYVVARKNYLDELEPAAKPADADVSVRLTTFATPGEYEPVAFVVYAAKDLKGLTVQPTALSGPAGAIPAANLDVRLVRRCLHRRWYWVKAEDSVVVGRFLDKARPMDVPAGTLKEVLVTIRVPDEAKGGVYEGKLTITAANAAPTELAVKLDVLPFKLPWPERKRYGLYYQLGQGLERLDRTRLELRDMREHGATTLFPSIGIEFKKTENGIEASYEDLEHGLALMREFGFRGTVPIETGLPGLARLLGHTDIGKGAKGKQLDGAPLDESAPFRELAKKGIEGLAATRKKFSEFDLALTHMDEVLDAGRLPLYIRYTKAARQVPGHRMYITMHNTPRPGVAEMTREIDPFVDIRCYNGHAMDDWLRDGHTFEELAQTLKQSGDEAWIYYNIRGIIVNPEWIRIINGLYMWLGPFKVHVPYIYHAYKGDPFDDTDGPTEKGHDLGYAMPSAEDGLTPVPTRHWEAFREGVDDIRYLCLLEDLVEAARKTAPDKAKAGQAWLDELRAMMPKDVSKIEGESPLLIALSQKFTGEDYQRLRRRTVDEIVKLMKANP